MKFAVCVYSVLGLLHVGRGQSENDIGDRGFFNRRPILGGGSSGGSSSLCEGEVWDPVDPESRTLLVAAVGGAAVGGVLGGAAGYHLGMKNQKPVVINNNIYNQLPTPCFSVPVHVSTDGGSGGGGGGILGGGLVGGLLSNHPILSNILQGGLWNGGGGSGGRIGNIATNRISRQFQRQVVRPLTRIFK